MLAACSPQLTRHPWLSDSRPQAEEKFKQIANAYTVLSDDEKRKVVQEREKIEQEIRSIKALNEDLY